MSHCFQKITCIFSICLLSCIAGYAQTDGMKGYTDSLTILAMKDKCTEVKSKTFKFEHGAVVRESQGFKYILLDTNGLYVYVSYKKEYSHEGIYDHCWKGYFSETPCGKLEELNYSRLEKIFGEKYPTFIDVIRGKTDSELLKQPHQNNRTLVNDLFAAKTP